MVRIFFYPSPMKYSIRILLALLIIATVSSCKRNAKLQRKVAEELKLEEFKPPYFTIKSKLQYRNGDQQINGIADIRITRDSSIWVSLRSKTGLEGVRLLITPQTVLGINRLEKVYYTYSFEQLSKKLEMDVNFGILQEMLYSNPPVDLLEKSKVKEEEDYFMISEPYENLQVKMKVGKRTHKTEFIGIVHNETKGDLKVSYDDFRMVNTKLFPFQQVFDLIVPANKDKPEHQSRLVFSVNRAETSPRPLNQPFKIPSKYTLGSQD